jgi:hypothetical protein
MATMENLERGYFNTDHSIGRGNYESMFAMDPALFNTSASISQDPSSHQDLDNILGGSFIDQLGSGSALMTTEFSAWDAQGTAYSPYPDISFTQGLPADQQQSGPGLGSGSMTNGFVPSFPEHGGMGIQAVSYPINQSTVQMTGIEAPKIEANTVTAAPAAKRKSEVAPNDADGTQPKQKKKRGPRKTKQKTEEEKRAKEERKLERNRMAASKCRQKKKVATEQMMENFNEMERQNHWMKACLEEVKQERNKILALLLEHKECNHPAVDKCLESQLARIAGEFETQPDTSILGMDDDTRQFLNSNASSPSNDSQNSSRRNSIAMSSPDSDASPTKSATHPPQSWPTAGFQSWQEQFNMSHQSGPSKASRQHSPSSASSQDTSMSRQNSSRTSVSEGRGGHQRTDSGISEIDTPPEERKVKMSIGSPVDEAISLVSQDRVLRSRGPHMMPNQRISNLAMQGPADLQDPLMFVTMVGL